MEALAQHAAALLRLTRLWRYLVRIANYIVDYQVPRYMDYLSLTRTQNGFQCSIASVSYLGLTTRRVPDPLHWIIVLCVRTWSPPMCRQVR